MAGFNERPNQRFADVKPGSKILVTDYQNAYVPFEAFVLEMKLEYGPQRIPMLMVKAEHASDPVMLMADGRTIVSVLVDSDILAVATRSPRARHLRAQPREVWGIQFTGGVDSATEVIQFAAGKAALSWSEGSTQSLEAMILASLEENTRVNLGDWIIEDLATGTIRAERGDMLESKYEDYDEAVRRELAGVE